jgi:hypothetical protein
MTDITYEQLFSNINTVIKNVDIIYKQTHTKTEYLTYKLGKSTSRIFKFIKSPQMKVLSLLVFWAMFVTSWILAAFAISTVAAFVVFGAIIAVYSSATMEAVSAIIQKTMFSYYSEMLGNVR